MSATDADAPAPRATLPVTTASSSSSSGGVFSRNNIMAVVLAFTWILAVVGTAEPVYERFTKSFSTSQPASGATLHLTRTLFEECRDDWANCRGISFECSSDSSKYDAGRAFTIIVDIFLALIVIAAMGRAFLPTFDRNFAQPDSLSSRVYFWTIFVLMFFSFLSWTLLLSMYGSAPCPGLPSVNSLPDSRLGSAGMFFLDVWILLLLVTIAECLKGRGLLPGDGETENYPALAQ